MKAHNPFDHMSTAELIKSAEGFAEAQEKLAADSQEDKQHWHHFALAHLIRELSRRLNTDENVIIYTDKMLDKLL